MRQTAKAFAPGNISCVFKIYEHQDPRQMGSYGIGFTINEGVIVETLHCNVSTNKNSIFFNDEEITFPTVEQVIRSLTKDNIKVHISSLLPLGGGFGLSGASALATAYALNILLDLKKSHQELAMIAHVAEVENKTGLGDVINQYHGGFLIKNKLDKDAINRVSTKLALAGTSVYCASFGKVSTKSVLTNVALREQINTAATIALGKVNDHMTFEDIITISKDFAIQSGLLTDKKTKETIQSIENSNGKASMIMLGNAVFSTIPFPGATKFVISDTGAHEV